MKKYIGLFLCLLLLASSVSAIAYREQTELPPTYATDAFCYNFETTEQFLNSNVSVATAADNTAENPMYHPGAGGSDTALHIRQDCSVYPNGILNSGIDNVSLFQGKTYRISAWVKILSNDIYKVEPNFNFIFLNSGTTLYEDETCTTPSNATGIFEIVTAKGKDIGFRDASGGITDEWRRLEVLYTVDNTFGKYFINPNSVLSTRLWLRVGSSAHGINIPSDYTDAFLDSIRIPVTDEATGETTYEIDSTKYYTEYLVDDWSVEPYVEPVNAVKDPVTKNDFESISWSKASDTTWQYAYSTCEITNDRPSEAHDTNNHVLQINYAGGPYTYTDFTALLTKDRSLMHNRAYKISFWLKGSEAAVQYYNGKSRYLKLIPERAYENRLERTKNKWAETALNDKLTESWQKYEYIWYEPTPHMLGRNTENNSNVRFDLRFYNLPKAGTQITETIDGKDITYVYSYQNKNGETVYADYEDFRFWLDDFTIEPLDIVTNGDFSYYSAEDVPSSVWYTTHHLPGTNTNLPDIFGAGHIESDASLPAGKNALVLTKEDSRPGQKVEIDSRSFYKISFRAKADTENSCGIGIAPLLDRSITGDVRDNSVTNLNPEGLFGYGNITGEIGDIPYYLYRGSCPSTNHAYNILAPQDGESIVYDDYFARMKSVNGYEAQSTPTAWNYQYYNGNEWVSQNHDAVESNWKLTDEWQTFECQYYWDYEGEHYRLPRLCIAAETAADFRITDIKVEEYNRFFNDFHVENVTFSNINNYYIGNQLSFQYDFVSNTPDTAEGNSVLKLLVGNEKGEYAVQSITTCHGSEATTVTIPDTTIGNRLAIEIIPVSSDKQTGAVYTCYPDSIVAGKIERELSSGDNSVTFRLDVTLARQIQNNGISAYMTLYDENNCMLKTYTYPISTGTFTETVPLGSAQKAKLFVMENTHSLAPCISNETMQFFGVNENPFSHTDELTVAYMGGSSMAGKGIFYPEESTYRAYITEYLTDAYPDKTIHAHNFSKDGANTHYGVSIADEVARTEPDIVFIDYAIDDRLTDIRADMTSMIKTLTSGDKIPYIIFLYTGDYEHNNYATFHKEVAERFKIPEIDLRAGLKTHLRGSDAQKEGYLFDAIHPAADGHIIYGETVIRALETGKYFHKPK